MWRPMWPDTPADQLPVRSITNGVHVPTWMAGPVFALLDQHFGPGWLDHVDEPSDVGAAQRHPRRRDLGRCASRCGSDLFSFIRERMRSRCLARARQPERGLSRPAAMLDPEALTIGYARRFTAYKRPELIFHDPDRLARILNCHRSPGADRVRRQGASRPTSPPSINLQRVFKHALDPKFGGRLAFIDDYDMHVAHYLVQGCDVWLNNPRKPLEASGTSGMKASLNGVPHLSIGDGWWAEGFNGRNGWLIESQANPDDHARDRRRRRQRALRAAGERGRAGVLRSRPGRPRPAAALDRRSCARRCARTCRASRRGAWSSSTSRKCTGRARSRASQFAQSINAEPIASSYHLRHACEDLGRGVVLLLGRQPRIARRFHQPPSSAEVAARRPTPGTAPWSRPRSPRAAFPPR